MTSLIPRHEGGGGERGPGTHCLYMCLIPTEFRGDRVRTCTYIYWWRHKLAVQLVFCSSEFCITLFYAFW